MIALLEHIDPDPSSKHAVVSTWAGGIMIPLSIGVISSWFWRNLELTVVKLAGWSGVATLLCIAGAAISMKEGVICLIIAAPILYTLIFTGAVAGYFVFRNRNDRVNATVIPLLVAFTIFGGYWRGNAHEVVTDTLRIDAPPSVVWKYVAEYPPIDEPQSFWLWKIGLPAPVQSVSSGSSAGSSRECIFEHHVRFGEVITRSIVGRELTFVVTRQPDDPEVLGHITVKQGQFILIPNPDGSTTLYGTSWYTLHVFPAAYYQIWAGAITSNVHLAAMRHIARLAMVHKKAA